MGVNNRVRRAAKKRKHSLGRPTGTSAGGFAGAAAQDHQPGAPPPDRQLAELLVADAVDMCGGDEGIAGQLADRMLAGTGRLPATVIGAAMERLLRRLTQVVVQAGWGPRDLTELVLRRLTLALVLAAVLVATPRIPRLMPPPGDADPLDALRVQPGGQDAKVLARVRALLAEAESTEFAEEAEALSAKAQELISRYSLDQLMAAADTAGQDPTTIIARRFWLDAPYVSAKASLVAEVARANRCSTVVAEKLGFTTVAGTSGDIDAVELLTTSLMVQADAAMLAAGRRTDRHGTSRTAALAEMFPDVVYKRRTVGNWHGWAEGRAAADQARLDRHQPISG